MNLKRLFSLLLPLVVALVATASVAAPAFCVDDSPLPMRTSDFLMLSEIKLEPIIKRYFPSVVFHRTPTSLRGEFKAAKMVTTGGITELIPKTDGVVLDVEVKPGLYRSKHIMPLTTYETLYYSMVWSFCSEGEHKHVIVKLMCPHDMATPISDDLKSEINGFVEAVESISPIAVRHSSVHIADSSSENSQSKTAESGKSDDAAERGKADDSADLLASASSSVKHDAVLTFDGVREDTASNPTSGGVVSDATAHPTDGVSHDAMTGDVSHDATTGEVTSAPTVRTSAVESPTKELFQQWFKKFFDELEQAKLTKDVTPYFSRSFQALKLPPRLDSLPATTDGFILNQIRKVSFLANWKIASVQSKASGCADVTMDGLSFSKKPMHAVFRMIAENGKWGIENGWTSGAR